MDKYKVTMTIYSTRVGGRVDSYKSTVLPNATLEEAKNYIANAKQWDNVSYDYLRDLQRSDQ